MNKELYEKIKASLKAIKKGIDDFNHRSEMRALYPPEVEFEFEQEYGNKVVFKVESYRYHRASWPEYELEEIMEELKYKEDHEKYCHPNCPEQTQSGTQEK